MTPAAMSIGGPAGDVNAVLPPLRTELEFLAQGSDESGAPTWVIYDPLQHRYFKIDHCTRELLRVWQPGMTLADLERHAHEDAGLLATKEQYEQLLTFISANRLCSAEGQDSWKQLLAHANAKRNALFSNVLERYLFFKVPLVNPNAFLRATAPLIDPVFSRAALLFVLFCGALGFYLVTRQWDSFVHTFHDLYHGNGAVYLLISIIFIKSLHELGHALTAARLGLNVPSMGIAFMVLAPLLYTDVTDAWRLQSRKDRIAIHAAGVIVELSIACIALLLWSFLPEGPWKALAFTISTTGLLLTLTINLNPLMRFDGYYVFSEMIGVDNLQTRANAFGRWKLRQFLLVPDMPPPEIVGSRLRTILIAFAWLAWVYRFFVFTAIAIIVYTMFFKALGLLLFAVEIWAFILRPIGTEIMSWYTISRSSDLKTRPMITLMVALLIVVLMVVPLSTKVEAPAVLEAAKLAHLFPKQGGMISAIHFRSEDKVLVGAPLVTLRSLSLENETNIAKNRLEFTRLRLARGVADRSDRDETEVLEQEAAALESKLAGLRAQRDELTLRAPFSGHIRDVDRNLHVGRWLSRTDEIAIVVGDGPKVARGYIVDSDLERVTPGAVGVFVPDDMARNSISVKLRSIANASAPRIDIAELSAPHGGPINVFPDSSNALRPVRSQYLVEFAVLSGDTDQGRTHRGIIQLNAESESLFMRAFRQVAQVVMRESGF